MVDPAREAEGLTPKAETVLRAIGKCRSGYPYRALHPAHYRFFMRHGLIEDATMDRCRTTAKADAMIAARGRDA